MIGESAVAKKRKVGLRDSSVGKVLATQARGPEFDSQNEHKKAGMNQAVVVHTSNPSATHRQRQADLCEFEARLSIERPPRTTQ